MTITRPAEASLGRCYELINRTNQLNISGERIPLDELRRLVEDTTQYLCLQISCVDRFGDYGIVGFCVIDIRNAAKAVLEHFVLSCRAAGKKIEQSFIEYLVRYFKNRNTTEFEIRCRVTSRNHLLLKLLSDLPYFNKRTVNSAQYILALSNGIFPMNLDIIKIEGQI